MNSTAFISSTTTLSLCTVNSTNMVVQKGNKSRFIYIHQDLLIYIKIYLYIPRFIYINQDLPIDIKIYSYTSRFLYIYQDFFI